MNKECSSVINKQHTVEDQITCSSLLSLCRFPGQHMPLFDSKLQSVYPPSLLSYLLTQHTEKPILPFSTPFPHGDCGWVYLMVHISIGNQETRNAILALRICTQVRFWLRVLR